LYGNLLSLTDGGTEDLTSLLPRSGTDTQTVSAALAGNTLQIKNQGTTQSATVDLSVYTNTDTQTLAFALGGTTTQTALTLTDGGSLSLQAGNGITFAQTGTDTLKIAGGDSSYTVDGGLAESRTISLTDKNLTFIGQSQAVLFLDGGKSQVGIGTATPTAALEISSKDNGVLIPRISLTASQTYSLKGSPTEAMLVYNTETATNTGLDGAGFYYWQNNRWNKIGQEAAGGVWRADSASNTISLKEKTDGSTRPETDNVFINDNGNMSIGTKNPETSAALQISSTTKAFLPPRMTTAQRDAIGTKVAGMVVYNTEDKALQTYDGSGWSSARGVKVVTQSEFDAISSPKKGDTYLIALNNSLHIRGDGKWHYFEESLPRDIIYQAPHDTQARIYGHIRSRVTGKIWLDRNLGAARASASVSDTSSDFGYFYHWGDATVDNHPGSNMTDACPSGYRFPTREDFQAELDGFSDNGGQNYRGAFYVLRLTRLGYRSSPNGHGPTATGAEGDTGYYWTSTTDGSSNVYRMLVEKSNILILTSTGNYGHSVRCIKD
jgi:uncharacterized protein (TIGR02145 family)